MIRKFCNLSVNCFRHLPLNKLQTLNADLKADQISEGYFVMMMKWQRALSSISIPSARYLLNTKLHIV